MHFKLRFGLPAIVVVAVLGLTTAPASATPALSDTFNFTSCHISGSTCEGGSIAAPGFGSLALSGFTNLAPVHADGTGDFTASVECTVASDCNGGSAPTINDLHFTVTNATLAQLETANANGNLFVADILCGAAQTQCNGLTGPVDVSTPGHNVPEPASLAIFGAALAGFGLIRRRRRNV